MADILALNLVITKDESGALQATVKDLDQVDESSRKAGSGLGFLKNVLAGLGIGAGILSVQGLVGILQSIPVAVLAAVTGLASMGSHLVDVEAKTGLLVEAQQRLAFAGGATGTSIDTIAEAISKMNQRLIEAPEEFEKLGLSVSALEQMNPDDALEMISETLRRLPSEAQRTAAAMALLGRGGADAIAFLKSDITGLSREAERLGSVLDKDTISALDDLDDATAKMDATWEGLKNQLLATIASNPEVVKTISDITEGIGALAAMIQNNKAGIAELFDILQKGAATVANLGVSHVFSEVVNDMRLAGAAMRGLGSLNPNKNLLPEQRPAVLSNVVRPEALFKNMGADWAQAIKDKEHAQEAEEKRRREEEAALKRFLQMESDALKKQNDELARNRAAREEATHALGDSAEEASFKMRLLTDQVERMGGAGALTDSQVKELVQQMIALVDAGGDDAGSLDLLQTGLDRYVATLPDAIEDTEGLSNAAFKNSEVMAEHSKRVLASWQSLAQYTDQVLGLAGALLDLPRAFASATDSSSRMRNALGGAQLGASIGGQIGSLFGPLGEAIGHVGGAIIGGIAGAFHTPAWKNAGKEGGRVLGMSVSEELSRAILQTSKDLGVSFGSAALLHVDQAIKESGRSASSFLPQVEQLLRGIKDGSIPAAEGLAQVSSAFKQMSEEGTTAGRRATAELLQAAKASGQMTPEMKAFVAEKTQQAEDSLKKFVQGVSKLDGEFDVMGANSATIFMAGFNAVMAEKGLVAAIDELGPSFETLRKKLEDIGDESALAILAPFEQMHAFLTNDVLRGAVDALDGLRGMMSSLSQIGVLDVETFRAMESTATGLFNHLTEGGMDTHSALLAIAPTIQEAVKTAEQFGVPLSEDMQRLKELAEANGIAFDADPMRQMVEVQNQQLIVMAAMAEMWGAVLPESVHRYIDALNDIPNAPPPPGMDPQTFHGGPSDRDMDHFTAARGLAPVELDRDTLIWAHRGERALVLPSGVDAYAAPYGFGGPLQQGPGGGSGGYGGGSGLPNGGNYGGGGGQSAGGGGDPSSGGGGYSPGQEEAAAAAEDAAAAIGEVQASIERLAEKVQTIKTAEVNYAPVLQIDENPLHNAQSREEMRLNTIGWLKDALRGNEPELQAELVAALRGKV